MAGENLTRDEARRRGVLIEVSTYDIDLDFSGGGDTFDSTTVIRFTAAEPGASTFLDLVAPRVREVVLNGRALDPAVVHADGRVALDGLAADNEVRIVADCAYMNTGEGLHRTVDLSDGKTYLYTHFEVPDARRLYATFEQPDLKGRFAFTVTAPTGWTVLSNSPAPEPIAAAAAGASTWRFPRTPPISTYITAVIAGEYHIVRDEYTSATGRVVPLAFACRASMAEHLDADHLFEVTKQGFDYYIERFGREYPFDKYDQIFVPEYNIGAMENVGCVTIVEDFIFRSKATDARYQARAETILHELAHMWFGDLVTMEWWDDLWLKESFATYVSVRCMAEATRWPHSWTSFANSGKAWGLRQDELPSTHPIVADINDLEDVAVNFDGITYAKGAAVLKQLVAWVGTDEFFTGVRHYFAIHEWGNTTLADLLAALEKTSGRDLTTWSREWLRTAGPNTLRPAFELAMDGTFASFAVSQEAPESHPTLRSHRIAIGLYTSSEKGLARTGQVEIDVTGARTEVPELVGIACPDLVLLNDDDLTYAKIRLDDASMATLRTGIGTFVDPLPRALCWAATWDMTRNAELAARDFIALVLSGIGSESDIGVVETLHDNIRTALDHYVDPAHLEATTHTVADAAYAHLRAAEPGSDLQLTWARMFLRLASRPADLAVVTGLRDGSGPIEGLTIDTEMRWGLLATLVRHGRADAGDIEAERSRDNTTVGSQYAAGALATRPTPEAKAEAWASVVDRDDLPNATQEAVIGIRRGAVSVGFTQSNRRDLIEPYVARYFAMIEGVWANRTMEIARNLVTGLYPKLLVTQDIVDRTDAFLDAAPRPAALRRLLLEERSNVVRALAARALDATRP